MTITDIANFEYQEYMHKSAREKNFSFYEYHNVLHESGVLKNT